MIIQCAWCNTIQNEIKDGRDIISHGICVPCADKVKKEIEGMNITKREN